ncbi:MULTISPECIES: acyltransferase family protein [Luteibacter]|uniref:acyltransferase family protein n=1 Tax=Luteibacter TaxID=242605 RepID=UPI000689D20A|nr:MULTISPECIES: acyltransferase [unclassified Luteibacter]
MRKDISADGLRGLAAVNVLLCHLFLAFLPGGFAWIYPDTTTPDAMRGVVDHVIAFQPLSVLWNGEFAVCIFFVLSGYVLTKSFIDTGDTGSFRLRASRRYLRLGVPIFGSVMFAWFVMAMGWSHAVEAGHLSGSTWLADFWKKPPDFIEALRDGTYGTILGGWSRFNPTLWTMKIELLGSMFVFAYRSLTLPGRAAPLNFAFAVALLAWFFPHDWPYYTAFLAGSHVGEARLTSSKPLLALAVVGAIICGGFDVSPWYDWTHALPLADNERKALFNVVGGILLLYVVRCGSFDRVLQSRPAQFMGRISYAFYLVHLPILLSFSAWFFTVMAGRLALDPVTAAMLTVPATFAVVIAVAMVFDRTFDRWGIQLAGRVFRAPRSSAKTVALRSVDGFRRRVRYHRRRVIEKDVSRRSGHQ